MSHFFDYKKQKMKGFTVIELFIGIFIFLLVGGLIFLFQKNVYSLNDILSDNISGQEQARKALKIMSAEIRSSSPSNLGAYQISQAGDSSFIFYCDIDNDQLKERIRYFLDGTILKKGVIKPSGSPLTYNPVNEQIVSFVRYVSNGATTVFLYYDKDYDGTTSPLTTPVNVASVRLVKINIIIDKDASELPGPAIFTTQISMRNLKDNL